MQNNNSKLKTIPPKAEYRGLTLSALRVTLKSGFTMVEIVVMLGIITMLSTIVLTNFTGLNEGAAIERAAQELAVNIRRTQNDSLAVVQYNPLNPPPLAVGVRISTIAQENTSFFRFADTVRDNKYTNPASPAEKIGDTTTFVRGIKIGAITNQDGQNQSIVHIMFAAPEATIALTDANGISIGQKIDIILQAPSGQTRKITVRTSGQINVQ